MEEGSGKFEPADWILKASDLSCLALAGGVGQLLGSSPTALVPSTAWKQAWFRMLRIPRQSHGLRREEVGSVPGLAPSLAAPGRGLCPSPC